jgi:hypothetical protein
MFVRLRVVICKNQLQATECSRKSYCYFPNVSCEYFVLSESFHLQKFNIYQTGECKEILCFKRIEKHGATTTA